MMHVQPHGAERLLLHAVVPMTRGAVVPRSIWSLSSLSRRRVFTTTTTTTTTSAAAAAAAAATDSSSSGTSSPQSQQYHDSTSDNSDSSSSSSSSILRLDVMTGTWVVYSKNRRHRPNQMQQQQQQQHQESSSSSSSSSRQGSSSRIRLAQLPRHVHDCPFCQGNEHMTPTVLSCIGGRNNNTMRVVPNKYPAVAPLLHVAVDQQCEEQHHHNHHHHHRMPFLMKNNNNDDGILLNNQVAAVGFHEVVIESDHHNAHLATGTSGPGMTCDLLTAFLQRGLEHRALSSARIEHSVFFKNHGITAGASLMHPHSQIVSTRKCVCRFFIYIFSVPLEKHLGVTSSVINQSINQSIINHMTFTITLSLSLLLFCCCFFCLFFCFHLTRAHSRGSR
jgi:Galactose-1-phosphate uridyl transferase, N-terminal domain